MADRIKGITVEIGGDTTGLSRALSGVNKDIKNTQTQLTDVERLLKLDSSNTELLSQKQKLLKDAIGEINTRFHATGGELEELSLLFLEFADINDTDVSGAIDDVSYIMEQFGLSTEDIIVGDFTYIADSEFENHVTNYYPWSRDKLIIGKFCQIAAGVEFVMNNANHQMNAVTTFPFYTLEGWEMNPPDPSEMPFKGDTVIGNDVWIGQNAVILPGVHIGDGAIVGANSVVGSDIDPYTIVVENPAKALRKRFDDELIEQYQDSRRIIICIFE